MPGATCQFWQRAVVVRLSTPCGGRNDPQRRFAAIAIAITLSELALILRLPLPSLVPWLLVSIVIENFFGRLAEFKRIAMRADKTDQSFASMIHLAVAVINSR
jgi:hypothetical protein